MPYNNIPQSMWDKMDSCVNDVQGQGHDKESAIAICHDSLMSGKELSRAIKEHTQKATAEDNNLPDSAFLYVESGGEKDGEGKTVPRSLRHLPYRTASGAVDLPRLRNALSRLGQMNTGDTGGDRWLTASLRDELIAKARRILENANKEVARGKDIAEMILPDGVDIPTLLQSVEDSLNAELSDEEMKAVEQLYRDIEAGKTKLESLVEPEEATSKASVSYGNRTGGPGGPAGNPSGTPGWRGLRGKKQERCFLHVKKLGGNEEAARRICRSMFGEKAQKEAAHEASFAVYKQADGHYRWVIFSSSSYRDHTRDAVS